MKNLTSFEDFINENYDFPGYGYAPTGFIGNEPKDPALSMNGYDKFKADMISQFNRLQSILRNVFSSTTYMGKSVFNFVIEDLRVFRIFRNNNGYLDIYIKFILDDDEYMGCFRDWSSRHCKFESAVLNLTQIQIHLENKIKLIGIFKKVLTEWFIPVKNEYKTLKEVKVYDSLGNIVYIPIDSIVTVEEVVTEDDEPTIILLYNNKEYTISNLDYYFFHWWFKEKEKVKYYV